MADGVQKAFTAADATVFLPQKLSQSSRVRIRRATIRAPVILLLRLDQRGHENLRPYLSALASAATGWTGFSDNGRHGKSSPPGGV